jgi:MFS family permease
MSTNTMSMLAEPVGGTRINRWVMVAFGLISMVVGVNTASVMWNVLGASMRADLGWSPAVISNGLSLFIVFDGISVFTMGYLADRFGIRRIAILLSTLFGLAMAAMSLVPNEGVFFLLCFLMGCGAGPATQAAYSIVVRAWFQRSRGLALGILAVGLGICTTIIPIVGAALEASVGWRGAFAIVGGISFVVLVSGYVFIVRMPVQYERERRQAVAEHRTPGMTFVQVVRDVPRPFWLVSIAIFLLSAGTAGVLGQIIPISAGQGMTPAVGVALLSVSGISSIASRFVVGWLLDRVFAPVLASVFFALCGLGLVLMITSHSEPVLFIAAILIGLGPGSETDVIGYVLSRYVPVHSYGRIYGFVVFLYAQGTALGIFMLGQSISLTGSVYFSAWIIVGMVAVSALLIALVGPYRYKVDGSVENGGRLTESDSQAPTAAAV